jgi:hypothetical protein
MKKVEGVKEEEEAEGQKKKLIASVSTRQHQFNP